MLQCDSHICHTKVREQCVEVRGYACIALCCSATHKHITHTKVRELEVIDGQIDQDVAGE